MSFQNALQLTSPLVKQTTAPASVDDSIIEDFSKSGRTAIYRGKISAPLKIILDFGLLKKNSSSLHYGKGRCQCDSDAIKAQTGFCTDYDYCHCPFPEVLGSSYHNVFAAYVMNTLPPKARRYVWRQVAQSTAHSGVAFIAVRSDKIKGKPSEDGVITSIGTFQKSYKKGELLSEASEHFNYVVEIKGKPGFHIVACSNEPIVFD